MNDTPQDRNMVDILKDYARRIHLMINYKRIYGRIHHGIEHWTTG
jgi:hypothetical protein